MTDDAGNKRFPFWKKGKRYIGLQIMTLSFLAAVIFALLALGGSSIRESIDETSVLFSIASGLLYFSWLMLKIAAFSMLAGILIHFWFMFSVEKK